MLKLISKSFLKITSTRFVIYFGVFFIINLFKIKIYIMCGNSFIYLIKLIALWSLILSLVIGLINTLISAMEHYFKVKKICGKNYKKILTESKHTYKFIIKGQNKECFGNIYHLIKNKYADIDLSDSEKGLIITTSNKSPKVKIQIEIIKLANEQNEVTILCQLYNKFRTFDNGKSYLMNNSIREEIINGC